MVIEVGLAKDGQNERPDFFNNDIFPEAFQSFCSDARAFLYVMGAVPLWFYRDPSIWLRRYMSADTSHARADLGLPFGVMDITKCYIKEVSIGAHGLHRAFEVVPLDGEGSHRDVGYMVFNHNMEFVDVDPQVKKEADLFFKKSSRETQNRLERMKDFPHMAMPRSTFYELAYAKKRMDFADKSMHEANWARAHPLTVLTSEPPPKLPATNEMMDDVLFARDPRESEFAHQQRLSAMSHRAAKHTVQQVQMQLNEGDPTVGVPTPDNPYGVSRRANSKREQECMDALEDAFVFDDNVKVAKMDEPAVLIDTGLLGKMYAERIYQQMGLPNDVFVSQRALDYRSNEGKQTSIFSNAISTLITDPIHQRATIDQRIYRRLFARVATAPFDLYHMDKIIAMIEEKDKAMDDLMNQVRTAIDRHLSKYIDKDVIYKESPAALLKQVKAMLVVPVPKGSGGGGRAADEKKAVEAAATGADDEPTAQEDLEQVIGRIKGALRLVKKFQISAQGLRYYLMGLQSHNPTTQSKARLIFEEREEYLQAKEEEKEMIELEKGPKAAAPPAKPAAKKPAKAAVKKPKKKKKKPEKKKEPAKKEKAKPKAKKASSEGGEKKRKRDDEDSEESDAPEKKKQKKSESSGDKTEAQKKKRKREDDDDSEESEAPKKKKQKKDDDDSEEDDDDESDDDDSDDSDEEKMKKKKKKKPTRKDD